MPYNNQCIKHNLTALNWQQKKIQLFGKDALADLFIDQFFVVFFLYKTTFCVQNIGSEVEIATIEKQRKELQLLIGELKDRDKELNDMVAVHQRQLLSWEEDRQKVLTLEERCSKLEGQKYVSGISSTLLYASILKGLTGQTQPLFKC